MKYIIAWLLLWFWIAQKLDPFTEFIKNRKLESKCEWTSMMEFIAEFEGTKNWTTTNKNSIPIIGIGYNLKRSLVPQQFARLGISYSLILNGTQWISDEQINALFQADLSYYESGTRMWARSFYIKLKAFNI